MIFPVKVLFQIVNLRMAIMTRGNTVVRLSFINLFKLSATIIPTGLRITGLQKATAPTTTIIVGSVRGHIHEILFTHNGLDNKTKILRYWISE